MYSKNNLGILAAVRDEVKDILDNAFFAWQTLAPNHYYSALGIHLIISGIGKAHIAFALGQIDHAVSEVLIIGTSGGLSNETIGSLYLCQEFAEHDMDATGLGFPPGVTPFAAHADPILRTLLGPRALHITQACTALHIILNYGRTISGDLFIANDQVVAAKRELFGGNLVDMESAAIAKICLAQHKPMSALRFITDNANHEAHTSWIENVKTSSAIMNTILEHVFKNPL